MMELIRIDTQKAYEQLRERIVRLQLPPGALIDEQQLSDELDLSPSTIREAIKLLAHDGLVQVTPRHGLYVAPVSLEDLAQLSEMREALESLCARLAAQRATSDELAVLEALRQEHQDIAATDSERLFELDHRFHQAIARAAHNKYLARTLETFFGLSQRLWYLALPEIAALPAAVEKHLDLAAAIQAGDADTAERLMRAHVKGFYDEVKEILAAKLG
ncbi:MAG: GntR family transcriptional regulator [Chloroflexi bacterium]|nr:GntR family transcriptional regulator [Chloroflexota bacterium]